PYPFSALNHFTVPLFIVVPPKIKLYPMQKEKPHISVNHDERRFTQIRGQSNTLIFAYYTIMP
ncbi:MAG: hypothetical protein KH216_12605, partial [Clostridiales bacterium]|nr:hypothetical protein [Clostridiales bacterium]